MPPVSANFLLHTAIISSQVIILACGYGFVGAVLYYDHLSPPDQVANLWEHHPQELTTVITLIATVLSVTTTTLFTISIKEALRHRITQPISLVQLGAGVALAKGSIILRHEHLRLTTMTLFIFGVLRLLTAGWITLLTPTYFLWPFQMQGSELDITGTAFSNLLYEEFQKEGVNAIQDNSFAILDVGGTLSGVSAAGYTFGLPGIFNFNGAKYDVSTQGIVPTIESYSGSHGIPGPDGTRLGFTGGKVTVDTVSLPGKHSVSIPQGFSRNYSMWQQGLTANVSCQPISSSQTQYVWDTSNSSVIYSNPDNLYNSITGLRLWNITANCGASMPTTQEYVTVVNASGYSDPLDSGFLPCLVCPGSFGSESKLYKLQRFLHKDFTIRADYSNGLISSEVVSSTPFRSENEQLLSFLAGASRVSVYLLAGASEQYDRRYSTQVYTELEEYWRGIVEFSATFLRSGFMVVGSFPDDIVPNNLSSLVNGTMYISTIGWTRRSATYFISILPFTVITIVMFASALYSFLQARKRNSSYRTTFDPSNPLHLIMASAEAGKASTVASAVGSLRLQGFDDNGITANERVKVQLQDDGVGKKFVTVD
ncbi:uncharacterized protein F5147DRAFT_780401 [Suillus discolor]|uniref:Uncharacterized protein n=1 Tax=Suillus discolor TaxID=1912936 RepID=A0A9P7JME6_9AGAM|nr:uncharacterized protein F5147DRAFT_780401 [Suillus discolor]KAG2090216.1 hypothetical protein F5147DRAFT_780401 [Suillus discolor]